MARDPRIKAALRLRSNFWICMCRFIQNRYLGQAVPKFLPEEVSIDVFQDTLVFW
jgi:hypothetical protein